MYNATTGTKKFSEMKIPIMEKGSSRNSSSTSNRHLCFNYFSEFQMEILLFLRRILTKSEHAIKVGGGGFAGKPITKGGNICKWEEGTNAYYLLLDFPWHLLVMTRSCSYLTSNFIVRHKNNVVSNCDIPCKTLIQLFVKNPPSKLSK